MKPPENTTKYASYVIEDGILYVSWADGLIINMDIAKELVEERIRFTKGKIMPVLIDISGLASIDTISRKYFAGERSVSCVVATAVLIDSLISKLAGNIFVTVDKPTVPTKLFNNREKAVKWLRNYK